MKYIQEFERKFSCSDPDSVFQYLLSTLKDTITKWDYFVNWARVLGNIKNIEIDLNILNYLIGKENIEEEFAMLLEMHPAVYRLIPILSACRENKFTILLDYGYDEFVYKEYQFNQCGILSSEEIKDAVNFAKSIGFLDLLKDRRIKSVVDYVIGVEVGLDSNGRKNRGGVMMEGVIEFFIKDICRQHGFEYIPQATAKKVHDKWNLKLNVDKSSRIIDFAVYNAKSLYLIETNFYGGGGSKLKSTAGEYITMFNYWKNDGHKFIWVTDGAGWRTASLPLRETFDKTEYILNLNMVSNRLLETIIAGDL